MREERILLQVNPAIIMNIAVDSQWNHEANNFAMDNNDYEKAFESYISDADDDGEFQVCKMLLGNHASITHLVTFIIQLLFHFRCCLMDRFFFLPFHVH